METSLRLSGPARSSNSLPKLQRHQVLQEADPEDPDIGILGGLRRSSRTCLGRLLLRRFYSEYFQVLFQRLKRRYIFYLSAPTFEYFFVMKCLKRFCLLLA